MNLFNITNKGVAMGKENEGTTSDRHLEIAYPANFHINTTLPDTINYTPEWWLAKPFFVNGISSTSIPMAFKKVGTHVYLQGSMNNARYDGEIDTFMILPPELRPMSDHYFIVPSTTAGRIAAFRITTSGYVQLLYTIVPQEEGYNASTNKGTWRYDFCTDYWTATNEPITEDLMTMPEFSYYYNLGKINGLRLRGNAGVSGLTTSQMQVSEASNYFAVYNNGDNSGTGQAGYGYITTDGPIIIPIGKTQVKAELASVNNMTQTTSLWSSILTIDAEETTITRKSYGQIQFSGNYINSTCGSNIVWNTNNYTAGTYYSFTLNLPENFNYARPVYVVINYNCNSKWRRDLRLRKLWFE